MAALALFAYLLTMVDAAHAGRTYAAYGGVYITSAIAWLWIIEGQRPDRWDMLGAAICLVGRWSSGSDRGRRDPQSLARGYDAAPLEGASSSVRSNSKHAARTRAARSRGRYISK